MLRRQEAIEGKVQLPVLDCLRGLSERIPRRRRGRLGRDQRGQDQDLSGGVSASREEWSEPDDSWWNTYFVIFSNFVIFIVNYGGSEEERQRNKPNHQSHVQLVCCFVSVHTFMKYTDWPKPAPSVETLVVVYAVRDYNLGRE